MNVQTYCRLRLILSANNNTKKCIEDRIHKAKRALFLLKQAISNNKGNICIKLSLSLFDKQIAPILLYGCATWALPTNTKQVIIQNIPESQTLRPYVDDLCSNLINRHANINSARRIGKSSNNKPREVSVYFEAYKDATDFTHSLNNDINNSYNATKQKDTLMDDLIENFHCRYLKYILGVNKYASNKAFPWGVRSLPIDKQG